MSLHPREKNGFLEQVENPHFNTCIHIAHFSTKKLDSKLSQPSVSVWMHVNTLQEPRQYIFFQFQHVFNSHLYAVFIPSLHYSFICLQFHTQSVLFLHMWFSYPVLYLHLYAVFTSSLYYSVICDFHTHYVMYAVSD